MLFLLILSFLKIAEMKGNVRGGVTIGKAVKDGKEGELEKYLSRKGR